MTVAATTALTKFLHRKYHELFGTLPVWRSARSNRDVLTLARLARVLERACTDLDPPLTLAQYRLLAMIGDGADRASQLAGHLALTKPTVSATVDTLVERGLVSARPTTTTAGRCGCSSPARVLRCSPSPRARCGCGSATCSPGRRPRAVADALAALNDASTNGERSVAPQEGA